MYLFFRLQERDLCQTFGLLLWTIPRRKPAYQAICGFLYQCPSSAHSEEAGMRICTKAVQNPASCEDGLGWGRDCLGILSMFPDWDALMEPHCLMANRADLSTWQIRMQFVTPCHMNMAVCNPQEHERGALKNQSHRMTVNTHRYASTKFLFPSNEQSYDSFNCVDSIDTNGSNGSCSLGLEMFFNFI